MNILHEPTHRKPQFHILVVDTQQQAEEMQAALCFSGYKFFSALSGREAKACCSEHVFDLIITEIRLPDMDGLVLLGELHQSHETPIIVCSATRRQRDSILALRLGADDFIQKPYDIYDLEARIKAVLRRSPPSRESTAIPEYYRVGDLVINKSHIDVTFGGKKISLTPTEYRLLSALASRPDEVFSRDELARRAWGYEDASAGRVIDVHIRRLRIKLESAAPALSPIISVRGFGYKIVSGSSTQRATPVASGHTNGLVPAAAY